MGNLKKKIQRTQSQQMSWFNNALGKMKEVGEKVGEGASKGWEKTKEGTAVAWEKTKEGTAVAWDKTKEGSAIAWDKTKEVSKTGFEKTKEWSKNTADKIKGNKDQDGGEQPPADNGPI